MATPRLPVEVCENIIDHCVSRVDAEHHEDVFESYGVLLACSLTCRDLLPRSRRNLYAVVIFTCSDQVDALCATLTIKPSFGEHTRVLRIDHEGPGLSDNKYISFARHELVSKLPNVQTLVLQINWDVYPPRYFDLVSLHYSITELFVWTPPPRDLFSPLRILSTFRRLERLHIYPPVFGHSQAAGQVFTPSNMSTKPHITRFTALRYLETTSENLLSFLHRPPLHTFGSSLVELVIRRDRFDVSTAAEIDEGPIAISKFAEFVRQCTKLEKLTVIEDLLRLKRPSPQGRSILLPRLAFSSWATSFISATQFHQRLRQISFQFWPPQKGWSDLRPPQTLRAPRIAMSRLLVLRIVFDSCWIAACLHLQNPRTFVFTLPAGPHSGSNAIRCTPDWWRQEIQARLKSSKVQVLVELTADDGTLWPCPWLEEDAEDWLGIDTWEYPEYIPVINYGSPLETEEEFQGYDSDSTTSTDSGSELF